MRIGELTQSEHAVKAANIHAGTNKNKIMLVLYSSKTHGHDSYPQRIKISALDEENYKSTGLICPFEAVQLYITSRGGYTNEDENLFVFKDKSNVTPEHVRKLLNRCLISLGLDSSLYNTHSFCLGRTGDLRREGLNLEQIRRAGRWSSNAVYKYLRF